jgi:hypothetical protein
LQIFPASSPLFKGRICGGASCRGLLLLWAAGNLSSSLYITGGYLRAINMPIKLAFSFNRLQASQVAGILEYRMTKPR